MSTHPWVLPMATHDLCLLKPIPMRTGMGLLGLGYGGRSLDVDASTGGLPDDNASEKWDFVCQERCMNCVKSSNFTNP